MEQLAVKLNDAEAFDAVLKNSLPEGGDLTIITKDFGTVGGNPVAMITFTVEVNGERKTAQTVTTLKLLLTILNVFQNLEIKK
jgi:hypothetical protein